MESDSTLPLTNSSTVGAIASSASSITVPALGNAITVCLSRDNFFLWILRAYQLFGYVDGSITALPLTITEGTGATARQVTNPDWIRWYSPD
jgi:hypothetical protein